MKIVNFKEFMKFPAGTVFCEVFNENVFNFDKLSVKYDNCGEKDFVYKDLFNVESEGSGDYFDLLVKAEKEVNTTGVSEEIKLDFECTSRDGLFDDNRFFAIFNKEDIAGLISSLQECL